MENDFATAERWFVETFALLGHAEQRALMGDDGYMQDLVGRLGKAVGPTGRANQPNGSRRPHVNHAPENGILATRILPSVCEKFGSQMAPSP